MKKLSVVVLLFCSLQLAHNQTKIQVDPSSRFQTIEGWGGSLSWWANIAGGYSDAQVDQLCEWITSPSGLNMNVFVFNIAGGENPNCPFGSNHLRVDASIQGYKTTESGSYDWTRDSKQRKILLKLKEKRSDCIFSACSYSPPYWMTYSGCTAGNVNGANNLKPEYYAAFADYLTDVVKYYHDVYGVTFRNLEPMNEPTIAWSAGGHQEGCSIWETLAQSNLIKEVYGKLSAKNMLGYCTVAGIDGSHVDHTVTGINGLITHDAISKITQINTHTYGGNQHAQLRKLAQQYEKRLWQSETGPINVYETGFDNNLVIAQRAIYDMNVLQPIAWLDWQLLDQGDVWGLIRYDAVPNLVRTKNYYTRMHFSRFIKPGYTIISNNNYNTLTAIDPENKELVVVNVNRSKDDIDCELDLSLFGSTGLKAIAYRTTSGFEGVHYKSSAYSVKTIQTISNLQEGETYTAKVWVRSTGGQTSCQLKAEGFNGGQVLTANLPATYTWTQLTISNIVIGSNRSCAIGIHSVAGAGNWCTFDDFEFYKNSNPSVNLCVNPGFESDLSTQTPTGWSTVGPDADADYTQSGGVSVDENCIRLGDITITNQTLSFKAPKRSISTYVIPISIDGTATLKNGVYKIVSKSSAKCLSVSAGSTANGAAIEQRIWAGLNDQKFNVNNSHSGYVITPSHVNKPINVTGYSYNNGAGLSQWDDWGEANQRFSIYDAGGGFYKIMARHSFKWLVTPSSGNNVVQWDWLGTDSYLWHFDDLDNPVGMKDIGKNANVYIYPNPVVNDLVIDGDISLLNSLIQIYNTKGQKVIKDILVNEKPMVIHGIKEKLGAGIYILILIRNKEVFSKKIVIAHR
jgi:O-glycosyl hydrolase